MAAAIAAGVVAVLAVAAPASAGSPPGHPSDPNTVKAQIASLANWLITAQRPDGAILDYPGGNFISAYDGSYAAMGLASAYKLTAAPADASAAWAWLHWYSSHELPNGVVDDRTVGPDGTETDTGSVDSTDATAGLFLSAAYLTFHYTNDKTQLAQISSGITGALAAIDLTRDSDGLTWATPGYHVKYLMDQAETYDGLRHASDLFAALNLHSQQTTAQQQASAMFAGIQTLWDPATGAFDWAKTDTGALQKTNWQTLYPDSAEQVWAVTYGLTTPVERTAIMTKFRTAQPNWDNPTASAQFMLNGNLVTQPVGYWPLGGLAFQQLGDSATLVVSSDAITSAAAATNYAWPYDTAEAGQLALDRFAETVGGNSVV
jgi:hypothetical protein